MKKSILALLLAAFATTGANAQLLKSGLFNGYSQGETLEKRAYDSKDAAPTLDEWATCFTSSPTEVPSPLTGTELSYPGYPEKGVSIELGTPDGVKGNHFSVFPIDTKKAYSKGVFYVACLVNMSKVASASPVDILGMSASSVSASNRATIKVSKEGSAGIKFGTNLLKSNAVTSMAYDYDKTHLVVMKLDYDNQSVSLFVNPDTDAEPAEADAVAMGDESNALKHALRGITVRNRHGHKGNIGNIRFARSWSDLFAEI